MCKTLPIFPAQIAKLISAGTSDVIAALVFFHNKVALRASHKIQLILQDRNDSIVTLGKFSVSQIQTNRTIFSETICT